MRKLSFDDFKANAEAIVFIENMRKITGGNGGSGRDHRNNLLKPDSPSWGVR